MACFYSAHSLAQSLPGRGSKIPDFVLMSAAGDSMSIQSLKGKVVFLDFWASWCFPCRITNKQLARMYPQYRGKNFEIVSVSVDESAKKWKKAIRKDRMSWSQLLDKPVSKGSIAEAWNITSIPASLLLNADQEIVAVNLNPADLEQILKKMLAQ